MTNDEATPPTVHAVTRLHLDAAGAPLGLSLEDGAMLDGTRIVNAVRVDSTGGVVLSVQILCPRGVEVMGPDGAVVPTSEVFRQPPPLVVVPDGKVRVHK